MSSKVDMKNLLSGKLRAVPLDLFNANGAMRHTAKSNLLSKIKIKRHLLPSLMGNLDLGTGVSDFLAMLESIHNTKFEGFSNVAEEIYTKLLSSLFKYELLVIVPDLYDFKFSAAE